MAERILRTRDEVRALIRAELMACVDRLVDQLDAQVAEQEIADRLWSDDAVRDLIGSEWDSTEPYEESP